MALLALRRPTPPTEPPPPLSPAREALRASLAASAAAIARLDSTSAPIRAAEAAAAREREATLALDEVAELEAANLQVWAEGATPGPLPAPLTLEREQAVTRLNAAHEAAIAAQRAAKAIAPACRAAEERLHALNRERPGLISAVLCEVAAELGDRVIACARERAALNAALTTLISHCEQVNDGTLRATCATALRGGSVGAWKSQGTCADAQAEIRRVAAASVSDWSALPSRLASDPSACVEIDAREPTAATGAAA